MKDNVTLTDLLYILSTADKSQLTVALAALPKWRRYEIRDLAARLAPEEFALKQAENGAKGGVKAMAKLTPDERRERAKRAAQARWGARE